MFYKPDFLSIAVVTLGLYVVQHPVTIKRATFRGLVLLLFISIIYDLIFMLLIDNPARDDAIDSGTTGTLRGVAWYIVWTSVFFRPIVIMIFWKDSLSFRTIIKNQGAQKQEDKLNLSSGKGLSQEDKLELAKIMNDYTKYTEKVEHEEESKNEPIFGEKNKEDVNYNEHH